MQRETQIESLNNHHCQNFPAFQSPRTSRPIAQSTTYRPTTPQIIKPVQELPNILKILPKPATEKSMILHRGDNIQATAKGVIRRAIHKLTPSPEPE